MSLFIVVYQEIIEPDPKFVPPSVCVGPDGLLELFEPAPEVAKFELLKFDIGPNADEFKTLVLYLTLPPSFTGLLKPNISLNALPKSLASDDDSPHIYLSKLNDADAFKTCEP